MLAPLAILGSAQAVRDEFLTPEQAEKYRLLEYAPDWPWEWYGLIFLFLTICVLLEGTYRAISAERKKIMQMNNMLPMTLNFKHPTIHLGLDQKNKSKATIQAGLVFENVGHRPIKYEMVYFEFEFGQGQKESGVLFSKGGIIAPGRSTEFKIPGFQHVTISALLLSGRISYKVTYGYFDGRQRFYEEREIDVSCSKSAKKIKGYDHINYLNVKENYGWLNSML